MSPTRTTPFNTRRDDVEALTIRMAMPADAAALSRLAQLDSAPAPRPVPTLVAEVGGELRAALSLDGRPAIADPFQRTAELVGMLAERARQLEPSSARRTPSWLRLRTPRPVPVPHA